MPRTIETLLALATLSATVPLFAQQAAYSADPGNSGSSYTENYTQPPAPVERSASADIGYPQQGQQGPPPSGSSSQQRPVNTTSEPTHGVWLVSAPDAAVQTVSTTADHTELRVDHGRANVNIYHPADHSQILVDLPAGQVSLLKDGLYTFNAETNTVRVLHGEAEVSINNAKPVKVKENHEFTFAADGNQAKAQEADPNLLRADLLQGNYGGSGGYRHGDGYGAGFYGQPYAYGPYGWPYYGFYGPGWGYPYYAFGGPFGFGYPYGYGVGLGFGYYGGFGGVRGGFGGVRGGYGFRR